jgi:hypothetical protein
MCYVFNPLFFKQLMWILSLSGYLSVWTGDLSSVMDIKLGFQITQYFHRISPLCQNTYQWTNQQLPSSLWTPLYNGHQTSVSNYSVISPEFDIHTRTLLNYGQIVCKLVALSQWTPLYLTACQGGICQGDKLALLPAQFLNDDGQYVTVATSL